MDLILQNTISSKQEDEVAFMHCFTADIMPHIQDSHPEQFGNNYSLGATFSLTMPKLLFVVSQNRGRVDIESMFSWTIPQMQMQAAQQMQPEQQTQAAQQMHLQFQALQLAPHPQPGQQTQTAPHSQPAQQLTTVVIGQDTPSNRPDDGILREFNPSKAAGTAGKLVFHFFSPASASAFAALARGM